MDPNEINTPAELRSASDAWIAANGDDPDTGHVWGWDDHSGPDPFELNERVYRPGWGACPNCTDGYVCITTCTDAAGQTYNLDPEDHEIRTCEICAGVSAIPLRWTKETA